MVVLHPKRLIQHCYKHYSAAALLQTPHMETVGNSSLGCFILIHTSKRVYYHLCVLSDITRFS